MVETESREAVSEFVTERGGRKHRVERERRAKIEKQKSIEFRVFRLKLGFKRGVLHIFIFYFYI